MRKLDIFYVCTRLGDCRFSRFRDMIAGVEMETGPCDPDYAPFRGGLLFVSQDLI